MEKKTELTTVELKDLLDQAKEMGVKAGVFYGGEPMLRDDIFDLIQYAHSLGIYTKIITNGLLIDIEKAKKLVESKLDNIAISIDTCDQQEDEIRGVPNAYLNALSALEELVRLREKNNIDIAIASLLMRPNLSKFINIIDLGRKYNVPVIVQLLDFSIFYYREVDRSIQDQLLLTGEHQKELEQLVDKLIEIKKKEPRLISNSIPALNYIKRYYSDPKSADIPCYLSFSGKIWVSPEGRVYLCQGLPPVGDLKQEKLKDIIYSDRWRQGVLKMFNKQCPGCSCDYASNVDAHLPLSWRDILGRKFYGKRRK